MVSSVFNLTLNVSAKVTPTMHKNLILPVDLKTVYPS